MNQIQDKVKDLVDVCANPHLDDFAADLTETLGGYYFTDITSDLMAKWIDRVVVMPTGTGNAYALAGYRGVGKSHFLAVFGAILSQPELRGRIKDSHVFASAERLIRRHYPVINVRRGTKDTLQEELKSAVALHFEVDESTIGDTPSEIVRFTSDKGGAGPSVLVIDTDIEREARVSRDDGSYLSEIAEAAEGTNVFVAVALDDDVATADGRNSGISHTFTIDYLDHEHLYKIIDTHIFPKNGQKRGVVTQIFDNFRSVLPIFRWSEQRFASVYPVHPVLLEVAPFVRLFVQNFALLTFVAQAGEKILSRPADSLIALDELFDHVEDGLRKATDLTDAFASYDSLNTNIVNKIPVMDRLKAKLVLKCLMLLSLDSEGATAGDIACAALIFDEHEPKAAIAFVEKLLEKLAGASEGRLWRMEREGRAVKYGFSLSGKEHFNTALAEAVQSVPDSIVTMILKRLMCERFGDCEFAERGEGIEVAETDVEWRGGVRRGRFIWNIGNKGDLPVIANSRPTDWEVLIDPDLVKTKDRNAMPSVQWKPDELKPEEFDTIRRYHALMSREDIQQTYRNEIRTTIQTFTIAIEKIWDRKFLQYGKLVIDGVERPFSSEAIAAHNLSEVFGIMLAPYYDGQFSEHPSFGSRLEMAAVDELSTGLFAARGSALPDVSQLAENFAVPLGLADVVDGAIQVRTVEGLLAVHAVTALMEMVATADGAVPMVELHQKLGSQPFGFTYEAQRLILTALVARGMIEFVTTGGDRIGSRSLDLRLVWDDLAGISLPSETRYSPDRLVKWAALLVGDSKLDTLDSESDRQKVQAELSEWLSKWNKQNLWERLALIPDDALTTELWHAGSRVKKSFGAAAEVVASVANGTLELEGALRVIQEAFSGTPAEFESRSKELEYLTSIIDVIPLRKSIRAGIAAYELTDEPTIETIRREILEMIDERDLAISSSVFQELELHWTDFRSKFGEYISARHEAASRSHEVRDKAAEILSNHKWWVFENLAAIDYFPARYRRESRDIMRDLRTVNCTATIPLSVSERPFCPSCGFSLTAERRRSILPSRLWKVINDGLDAFQQVIRKFKDELLTSLVTFVTTGLDASANTAASGLAEKLASDINILELSENELRVLRVLFERHLPPPISDFIEATHVYVPEFAPEAIIDDVVVVNS